MNTIYDAIESKYGFSIPDPYRQMHQLGWFDARDRAGYLWVFQAEWLTPQEILSYDRLDYHKPGFVPFAFTGAGDNWCWWPSEHSVVLCPHDCLEGEFDAPDFLGSIYRRTLEYAGGGFDRENEREARQQLRDWAARFTRFFQPAWIDTLIAASQAPLTRWERGYDHGWGFLSLDEQEAIVRRDLPFDRLGERFQWMYRST